MENNSVIKLLFVDDEQSILDSLSSLFRGRDYEVYTASTAKLALEVLDSKIIDLVISDMRMPEMSGAEFLGLVAVKFPETIRILLTGYSDINATIDAINTGGIYSYQEKPWNNESFKLLIKQASESKKIHDHNKALQILTEKQNTELKRINDTLEEVVNNRTADLNRALKNLQSYYRQTILVFSNLIHLREGKHNPIYEKIAIAASELGELLGCAADDTKSLYFAGLLHTIGKVGLDKSLADLPQNELEGSHLEKFMHDGLYGHAALISLEALHNTANLIRVQYERYDGTGFPDCLKGSEISLPGQIFRVVRDYYYLIDGKLFKKSYNHSEALAYLEKNKSCIYAPNIVDAFSKYVITTDDTMPPGNELTSIQLQPGMVLAEDLRLDNNILLLSKNLVLTDKIIENITIYESYTKQNIVSLQ